LNLKPWYWFALCLLGIVLFVNFRLRDSRMGRAWVALREDEVAAVAMGVPSVKTKLMAYATGASFGGIAGAYLGSLLNTVNADQFQFSFSILVLAMIILGGLGSIWGVVLGAIVLSGINNYLIPDVINDVPSKIGLEFDMTQITFAIYGFLLVMMMILRPQGLLPERRHKMELAENAETIERSGSVKDTSLTAVRPPNCLVIVTASRMAGFASDGGGVGACVALMLVPCRGFRRWSRRARSAPSCACVPAAGPAGGGSSSSRAGSRRSRT
jgi:hypothetical protein